MCNISNVALIEKEENKYKLKRFDDFSTLSKLSLKMAKAENVNSFKKPELHLNGIIIFKSIPEEIEIVQSEIF